MTAITLAARKSNFHAVQFPGISFVSGHGGNVVPPREKQFIPSISSAGGKFVFLWLLEMVISGFAAGIFIDRLLGGHTDWTTQRPKEKTFVSASESCREPVDSSFFQIREVSG